MKVCVLGAIMAFGVVPAAAETTYQVKVSNPISKEHPSCLIEVWAVFDEPLFAFAGAQLDVLATPDEGGFFQPTRLLKAPGTSNGKVGLNGDSVTGILSGQIKQLPLEPHLVFDNPALIWRGKWSTTDFSPRTIELRTDTSRFEVYVNDKFEAVPYLGPLFEAVGEIKFGACYADCDGSGFLDLFDFLCFNNGFNAGDPSADCDGDGEYDLFDFLCFMNEFGAGC